MNSGSITDSWDPFAILISTTTATCKDSTLTSGDT
jgi:hypothetical protein